MQIEEVVGRKRRREVEHGRISNNVHVIGKPARAVY